MNEKEKHIDNFFKKGLAGHEVVPPSEVWDNIRAQIQKKQKKGFIVWFPAVAAVIIVLLTIPVIMRKTNPAGTSGTEKNTPDISLFSPADIDDIEEDELYYDDKNALSLHEGTRKTQAKIKESYTFYQEDPMHRIEGKITVTTDRNRLQAIESFGNFRFENKNVEDDLAEISRLYDIRKEAKVHSDKSETKNKGRWFIGGVVSPTYAYRNIQRNSLNNQIVPYFNQIEKGMFTMSAGVNMIYQKNRRLSFQTGLYYSKLGQRVNDVEPYFSGINDKGYSTSISYYEPKNVSIAVKNSIGEVKTSDATVLFLEDANTNTEDYANVFSSQTNNLEARLFQYFEFIEIPLYIKYKFFDKDFDMHITGGISTGILVQNKAMLKIEDNKKEVGETGGIKKMSYTGGIGLDFSYPLNHRLMLTIQPTFKYHLNSLNNSHTLPVHLYSFGVYTGFFYQF